MDRVPTVHPDPICPLCSKPILANSLVVFDHGELYHVTCRAQNLGLALLSEFDRARAAQQRATELIEETKERQKRWKKRDRPDRPT